MSLGTPRRMKMASRCLPPRRRIDSAKGAGSEVVVSLVPRACRGGIFNGVSEGLLRHQSTKSLERHAHYQCSQGTMTTEPL
jgi:hypothetical protein